LLPGLLRRGGGPRRRRLVIAWSSLAAACVVALAVLFWPFTSSPSRHDAVERPFVAVAQSPVGATATLTAEPWGTAIDLHCHYLAGVRKTFRYDLAVYGRDGTRQTLGSWRLPPDRDITFPAGTALPRNKIAKIEITLPDGTVILRLTT
jgi:hypothetical protein